MNPARRPFISDAGAPIELKSDDGGVRALPRYGVWAYDAGRGRHQVVECSDDLPALLAKYNLTAGDVHLLPGAAQRRVGS